MKDFLAEKGESAMQVEIVEEDFQNALKFADCSISPVSAFFGGIVA